MEIRRAELYPQTEHPWANYVLGVVSELDSLGFSIPNFSARVNGDLPAECGLASSAALEVATALFLLKLSRVDCHGCKLPSYVNEPTISLLVFSPVYWIKFVRFLAVKNTLSSSMPETRKSERSHFHAGLRCSLLNQVATGNSPAGSIISGAKKRSWPPMLLASRLCEMRLAPPSKNPICRLYCCVVPPTSLAKTSGSGERLTFSPPVTISVLAR